MNIAPKAVDIKWVSTERVHVRPDTDPTAGRIVWDPLKSLWLSGLLGLALVCAPITFSVPAFAVFVGLTGLTILAGHSVGMHRLLIHHAFSAPLWLERLLIWLGTLVGMAGPFGMMRVHDMRDWHQKQQVCPDHPAHNAGFWQDAWWQLHCRYDLDHPPDFRVEANRTSDPFLRFVEKTWMLQQLPLAAVLWLFGGWAFVIWGVAVCVPVSLIGHWAVGHYAHRKGRQGWVVDGLPVQGYNLVGLGLVTFGENWHGNHHAFPHSARLGVERGQLDPGYGFIMLLEKAGLARDVQLPWSQPARAGLRRLDGRSADPEAAVTAPGRPAAAP